MSTVPDRFCFRSAVFILVVAAWAAFAAQPAHASLGSDVASVRIDEAHMRGSTRIAQGDGYAVHEIQSPAGPTVRPRAVTAKTRPPSAINSSDVRRVAA